MTPLPILLATIIIIIIIIIIKYLYSAHTFQFVRAAVFLGGENCSSKSFTRVFFFFPIAASMFVGLCEIYKSVIEILLCRNY